MSGTIEIIPAKVREHRQSGDRISIFSVTPYGTADDWQTVVTGWTLGITDHRGAYTQGIGRKPFTTAEEAREHAHRLAAIRGATVLPTTEEQ